MIIDLNKKDFLGLKKTRQLLNEVGDALAFGMDKTGDENVLIFDLGGGTFSSVGNIFETEKNKKVSNENFKVFKN